MNADLSKLELLLSEDRTEEAKALISEIVSAKLSEKDQAGVYIGLASAYMDIVNGVNHQYKAALEQAIAGLERIDRVEGRVKDGARVAEIRQSLKKSD